MKYCVTSVILPEFDVPETCALLQELGYDGVEWRVRYTPEQAIGQGFSMWGEHKTGLSPANLAQRAHEVARITADHGLEIPAIAANLRCDELDEIKRLADGVARMGQIPIRLARPPATTDPPITTTSTSAQSTRTAKRSTCSNPTASAASSKSTAAR